jgi:hypothetical protein
VVSGAKAGGADVRSGPAEGDEKHSVMIAIVRTVFYTPGMNIDERIEKLTERHEALAQSVEMLSHTVETISESVDNLNHILRENSERTDAKILALLTLAGLHQKRLDGLEGLL